MDGLTPRYAWRLRAPESLPESVLAAGRARGLSERLMGILADLASGTPTRGPTAAQKNDSKQPRGAVVMVPISISVAAGEVCQSMHCADRIEETWSARIEGGAAFDGK